MNGKQLTTYSRLLLAFLFSILLHVVVLYTPTDVPLLEEPPLPPLNARLEPLPQTANAVLKSDVAAEPEIASAKKEAPQAGKNLLRPMVKSETTAEQSPLPRHIQLDYDVYRGTDFLKSGEVRSYLDMDRNRYVARSVRMSSGVGKLLDRKLSILISRGQIGSAGFQPDSFQSKASSAGKKRNRNALFDRNTQTLRMFDGNLVTLPQGTQDIVSLEFQLSRMSLHGELFSIPVTSGNQPEDYRIEIGRSEQLETPMGTLQAFHLRQIHSRHEAHFEVWLGEAYRLLPVQYVWYDEQGKILERRVITAIRASED